MNLIKLSGRKEGSPQCNMDPTKIILENVGRNFNGNYSCQVRRTEHPQFSPLYSQLSTVSGQEQGRVGGGVEHGDSGRVLSPRV